MRAGPTPTGKTTRIQIVPERHTKVYENWLENIRDWCISRQLWWGHRIPVWYCGNGGHMTVAIEDPTQLRHLRLDRASRQDEDTLDTWFSSALWPFCTLGWPERHGRPAYFYPTDVMETGYDIIFLWVARMIMMGIFALDDVPFEYVYFHGTVRDDQGQRMSKSKGNGVDPEVLIDRYGSDAVRFKLVTAGGTGNDQRLEEARMEAARNFANKLWNASRFVLGNLQPGAARRGARPGTPRRHARRGPLDPLAPRAPDGQRRPSHGALRAGRGRPRDRGVRLGRVLRLVPGNRQDPPARRRRGLAAAGAGARARHRPAPAAPLHALRHGRDLVRQPATCARHLRSADADAADHRRLTRAAARPGATKHAEREMALVQDVVRAVRNLRRERDIDAGRWLEAYVVADARWPSTPRRSSSWPACARCTSSATAPTRRPTPSLRRCWTARRWCCRWRASSTPAPSAPTWRSSATRPASRSKTSKHKLSNEGFTSRAPENIVTAERERLEAAKKRLADVEARLRELELGYRRDTPTLGFTA